MASLLIHSEIWKSAAIEDSNHHHHRQSKPAPNLPQHALRTTHGHDAGYYASCYVAGGLSSSIRWVLSPLELIKTRLQTATTTTATTTTVSGAGNQGVLSLQGVYAQHGTAGLFRGLGPTAVAYWFQTSTKYGLYELLKDRLTVATMQYTGEPSRATVQERYGGLIYVTAAGTAEAVADVLMCPWEMLRVKVQTDPAFPGRLLPALRHMLQNRQQHAFPLGALGPLWGRQIPSTIVNFYTFESASNFIYTRVLNGDKRDYTQAQQLGVTFCAGYIAGFCCTVVSHPADSIVSLLAVPQYRGFTVRQIVQSVGLYRLATRGLLPRILLTGKIISVQWFLYDTFKSVMGLGTSGG